VVDRDGRTRRRLSTAILLVLIIRVEEAFAEDAGRDASAPQWKQNASIARAIEGAASKLSNAPCRGVFSDFRDGAGHTLQENLDGLGLDGLAYLSRTFFYDGTGRRACASSQILAATSPGSHVVFVCIVQFAAVERSDPGLAAALLIHEELHSLGLGENPPDSKVITAQVIARCGK
jgi:hypothetical protein